MPTYKRMGLQFTASLAVAGVLFYFAKRNVASKRKVDLDESRTSTTRSLRGPKDLSAENGS